MCKMASFVLTKDRVFWSKKTDSHEEIIREFDLSADGTHGPNILRVEIAPPNDDYTLPLDKWVYKVDQDTKPKWHDKKDDEARTRLSLIDWAGHGLLLPGQKIYFLNDGDIVKCLCGGTISEVRGGTISEVRGGTISVVRGGTISEVWGGTISEVRGGTISVVSGGTISAVWGGTISVVSGGTISEVRGGTISEVWGGTISEVRGGTISAVWGGDVKNITGSGIVIDRSGKTIKIITADKSTKLVYSKQPRAKK